jgi:DnaJ C terminal domain
MPKKRKTDHRSANAQLGSDSDDFVHVSDASFPPTTWGPKCKGKNKENESKFSIKLTLEDFFHGTRHRYRFTRYLLSGKRKTVILNVDIPPGCRPGTKIFYPGVGHERPDGTLQDVVIVIEQVPHERFGREKNDLVLDVDLLWMKTLEAEKAEILLEGLNGESFEFVINYPVDKSTRGRYVLSGGGMPIREGRSVVGRGDLIVRYIFFFVPSALSSSSHIHTDGKSSRRLCQNGTP